MKLYRFEKAEKQRCNAIIDKKIYISAPSKFNDLHDCRISFSSAGLSQENYIKIMEGIELFYPNEEAHHNSILSPRLLTLLKKVIAPYAIAPKIDFDMTIDSTQAEIDVREEIISTTGVCSFFCSEPNSALMWAHYADNHAGFCVEYEVSPEPGDLNLFSVNYSSQLPIISASELIFSPVETFTRIVTTKKIEWAYENEWRIIHLNSLDPNKEENGKLIDLPAGMKVTRIIAGCKLPDTSCYDMVLNMANQIGIDFNTYKPFRG